MATLFRRASGIYYLVSVLHGKRIWESTGTRNKAEALRYLVDKKRRGKSAKILTLSQFETQFVSYANTNLAPSTVLLHKYAFKNFRNIVGDIPLGEYTPQMVEEFKNRWVEKVSPTKVNIDYRCLKAAFNTAMRWGLVERNPFCLAKPLRIPPQRPVFLTPDEFNKVLAVIKDEWYRDIVRFAVATMMRVGEIVNLQWSSVDFERQVIHVENTENFRTKSRKSRIIPMDPLVMNLLKTRPRISSHVFVFPEGRKFTVGYVSHRFKKAALKAGLSEGIHFHSLRHTGATWLVQNGVPIYNVQHILGHSSIAVTQIYSHLRGEDLRGSMGIVAGMLRQPIQSGLN